MKRKLKLGKYAVFFIAAFFLLSSCDGDNEKQWVADSSPQFNLTSEEVHSEPGRTFVIGGEVTDELGIDKIRINIDEWYLDKTIQVYKGEDLITGYSLNYSFEIPEDAQDKEFNINVTITNVGGLEVTKTLSVFMDGDFDNPVLDVKSPVNGLTLAPEGELPVDIHVLLSDARQLGYFVAKEASLDYYDSISFEGTGKLDYEYQYTATLPAQLGEYNFSFTVADSAGNVVSADRIVKASFDFDKLYLADVKTDAELVSDLFGVPMLITKTAPYNFEAKYYSEAAGTEIKFIPQTTSFAPHCYGIDPNDETKLINDPENALPIILDAKGYFKITVDLEALTYSVEQYTPDTWYYEPKMEYPNDDSYIESEYVGKLGLVGKGFPDYPDQSWATWASIPFDRDPENNYRFYKTIDMEGTVEFIFQPEHPWGWWPEPFWRFDRKVDPEATVLKGGDNVAMEVPERTTYRVIFDSHLNRAKVIKVD
ncbi:hypothetical protein [Plebeiibacterium marinum]|uniref:Uncharacterized protein n=1 Tax=Plebeiibacterium marinum TaxID=2992111 RepID=A0AAE3SJD4_9BACT|nr:hypothetical protein [Plebeiobacterium marinum]MCW3805640.1 hypothetical protein [Plebeiobacterium marinum]